MIVLWTYQNGWVQITTLPIEISAIEQLLKIVQIVLLVKLEIM